MNKIYQLLSKLVVIPAHKLAPAKAGAGIQGFEFRRPLLYFWITILSALILLTQNSIAQKGAVAAILTNFSGPVSLKTEGSTDYSPAQKGQVLYEGDFIKTGEGGLGALTFITGIEVRVNEKTDFVIRAKDIGELDESIALNQGQVYSKVLRSGSKFGVQTNAAVASVRGTEFDIQVKPPIKRKIKVKVRKSRILEKGLAQVIQELKEAFEREMRAKRSLEEAENLSKGERKKQEALLKEAVAARKKAEKEKQRLEKEAKKREDTDLETKEVDSLAQEEWLSVFHGTVELKNSFGIALVGAGQMASVLEGEAPKPPQAMAPEERPTWQEGIQPERSLTPPVPSSIPSVGSAATPSEEKNLNLEIGTESGKKSLNLKFKKVR